MTSSSPQAPHGRDTVEDFLAVRHGKWVGTVLSKLDGQTLRFTEIKRLVPGISQKALTHSLRELERDGFVIRTSFATIPPRVDYELTEIGTEVLSVMSILEQFVRARWDEILASRERFDSAMGKPTPVEFIIRQSR